MKTKYNPYGRPSPAKNWFAISRLFPYLFYISLALGIYFYIKSYDLLQDWFTYIYYAIKLFVGLEIILGSAISLVMPLLAIAASLGMMYANNQYELYLLTDTEAWQLLITAGVGAVITLMVKLK